MHKKLFIFDLDGVLVDACNWHRDALNEALLETCSYSITEEEHLSTFNGIPTREKLCILTKRGIVEAKDHQKINDLKQEKTIGIIKSSAKISLEKIKMIEEIKKRGNLVCCYTNSIRKTAMLMLHKTGIDTLFDYVLTNEDVKKTKPDPEGYIWLMREFDIKEEMCYIIEDSPKGLNAAYASKANVVEVEGTKAVNIELLRRYL
jgi:HAD superfamily hydrolase (TIGR01509 family)